MKGNPWIIWGESRFGVPISYSILLKSCGRFRVIMCQKRTCIHDLCTSNLIKLWWGVRKHCWLITNRFYCIYNDLFEWYSTISKTMYFTVLFLMSQQHFDIIWEIQLYEAHGTFSKMEDYYLWKLDILRMRKKYVSLNIHRGARDPLHTTLLVNISCKIT